MTYHRALTPGGGAGPIGDTTRIYERLLGHVKPNHRMYIGLLIGAVFLYFALRRVNFTEMVLVFSRIRWALIVVALVLYCLVYVMRMFRWRYLMLPIQETKYRNLFSALAIGFGANNMFPMRLGELIRAYTLGKLEGVRASSVMATIVVERVSDALTVLGMLVFVFFFVAFPEGYESVTTGLRAVGTAALIAIAVFIVVLVVVEKNRDLGLSVIGFLSRPFPERVTDSLNALMTSFADGLDVLYHGRKLIVVVLFSLLVWIAIAFFYWVVFFALGIHLPFSAAIFVTVVLAFAVSLPAPPGYIGTFHAAARYALVFFGLPASQAAGLGIIMHAMTFFPAIILGLIFIWLNKMSFGQITGVQAKWRGER